MTWSDVNLQELLLINGAGNKHVSMTREHSNNESDVFFMVHAKLL
jgi:hypothetical protein